MTDSDPFDVEELTDEQIDRVLHSRGFQKMLAYQRLSEGVEVLAEQDGIYESMVSTITAKHSSVSTEDSVRQVLELFREEVETFTDPLTEPDTEHETTSDELEDLFG